jgi:hypothetical protein
MKSILKITNALLQTIHEDLDRKHTIAYERVGFLTCRPAALADGGLHLSAAAYHPVSDEDYIPDDVAAAMLGPGAFRNILQRVYNSPSSVFHVHRHDHFGRPRPSQIDETESRRFIPDFWKACPKYPHGTLILSYDAVAGTVWYPDRSRILSLDSCVVVGDPLYIHRGIHA